MKLYMQNLFSAIGITITMLDINQIVSLLVLVTALILNIKKMFEK